MINKKISGDLFGGLTAAVVALPLALAFGVSSGMGAIAGLYGAIAIGIFASLFGGTKTQISGPTGPMTVVAASVVAAQIAYFGSLEAAMGPIVVTFVLAGLFQILFGVIRIGQYVKYMPYPVISGFMSGIGVIIIILQIFPFFGLESPQGILATLGSLGTIAGNINMNAVFLALGTIATIYLAPKVTKVVPSPLIALILFTVITAMLGLDVPLIGEIPTGLPEIHWDAFTKMDWHDPMFILVAALTLSALGAIDSLLTSIVADNMTKTQHDSNRELIGQGIGNAVAGIIGGIPGAGATMRTVVNIKTGGNSRLSGVFHGVVLIVILLGAGAYAKLIPIPVLAGILITVGIGILDYKSIKDIKYIPRSDAVIMIMVLLLTVLVDLLQAVAVGMVMASLWFMKQMGDVASQKSKGKSLQDLQSMGLLEAGVPESLHSKLYIQNFDGPIFFGFSFGFKELIRQVPDVKYVVFRMKNVPYIDQSGMYAIEEAVLELQKKGVKVLFCYLQTQPKDMLAKIRLFPGLVSEDAVFDDFKTLVDSLQSEQS